MWLSAEQIENLKAAVAVNRLRTLLRVVTEIVRYQSLPETAMKHKRRLLRASPGMRREITKQGFVASKVVGDLGKAMTSKKLDDQDVVDLIEKGITFDLLETVTLDRICIEVIGSSTVEQAAPETGMSDPM